MAQQEQDKVSAKKPNVRHEVRWATLSDIGEAVHLRWTEKSYGTKPKKILRHASNRFKSVLKMFKSVVYLFDTPQSEKHLCSEIFLMHQN